MASFTARRRAHAAAAASRHLITASMGASIGMGLDAAKTAMLLALIVVFIAFTFDEAWRNYRG